MVWRKLSSLGDTAHASDMDESNFPAESADCREFLLEYNPGKRREWHDDRRPHQMNRPIHTEHFIRVSPGIFNPE
jgi:hypothetical protein